jgi:hypothetical protein
LIDFVAGQFFVSTSISRTFTNNIFLFFCKLTDFVIIKFALNSFQKTVPAQRQKRDSYSFDRYRYHEKYSTFTNTDGIINKLVMVFARSFSARNNSNQYRDRMPAPNKFCTRTAKTTPYPPCTVTVFRLKNTGGGRCLRRVTLT